MPQNVTLYRILIASPSDLVTEREIVSDVIAAWNVANSLSRSAFLEAVTWQTHAVPEMGERPQGILNRQLVDKCDILVGLFWTRLGTPTGEEESGTVEEIRKFIKTNKPVMLYFSAVPVPPDGIEADQYAKLVEFREECRQSGLFFSFDSPTGLREQLQTHLSAKMNMLLAQSGAGVASAQQLQGHQLGTTELRNAFLQAESRIERTRRFRDERLAKIAAGDGPVKLSHPISSILHVVPFLATDPTFGIDLSTLQTRREEWQTLFSLGWHYDHLNFDGYLFRGGMSASGAGRYLQVFRNGAIEFVFGVETYEPKTGSNMRYVPMESLESFSRAALLAVIGSCRRLGIKAPLSVMYALCGVRGTIIGGPDRTRWEDGIVTPVNRDTLTVHEWLLESLDDNVDALLHPMFDEVWNASGQVSPSWHSDHNWLGR